MKFKPGLNTAVKIPKSKHKQKVAFYRDILLLETQEMPIDYPTVAKTHRVNFGNPTLWLDRVDNYTHSEVWMQLTVSDVEKATEYLRANGVATCDELEDLDADIHWILDPASTVFNLQWGD